jgi:hypothetical protein
MRCLTLFFAVLILPSFTLPSISPTGAQEWDLSGGVLITHCPLGLQFTDPAPPEGWCRHYSDNFAINCCHEQRARIDTAPGEGSVWYILAAWDEQKEFCGVDLGFGAYDADIYEFIDWDPCFPGAGLELPTNGWPGPNEGSGFVIVDEEPWFGNFVPIYFFAGYAHEPGVIPIDVDPATDSLQIGNCLPYPICYGFDCVGAMGVLSDGIECCPQGGPSPRQSATWGSIKRIYR